MAVGSYRKTHLINSTKMGLQFEQLKNQLKAPSKGAVISKAVKHQLRLRFHTETYLDRSEIAQPVTTFLDWVALQIPKDKFQIFVNLFKFPTPIVEFTGRIYNELERVFDGRNPAINFQFMDSTFKDDWEWYRQEYLKEPEIWKAKGWPMLKTNINSVLIVDLPSEQKGERPEPYFYWLDIQNVIDYSLKGKKIEWIIFRQPKNQIAVFDDEFYRIFQLNKKGEPSELLSEKKHELGYCPAQFFWQSPLFEEIQDLKKSPLSPQLSNLDWLLFFSLSKRHLDLYAPYPIYSSYEADCNFRNNETMDYCEGGFLRDSKGDYKVLRDGTVEKCPVCSSKRIAGVGSYIEVPIPRENGPDLREPVSITTVDKESLDYNVSEQNRLKEEIYNSIVGVGGEVQKNSINEMQIKADFEGKTSVLNMLKTNFEIAQKFIDDTICRLRYGNYFIGSSINWGTEFYIYTVDDLYRQYKQAKENGANESQLDAISDQIIATENKNNPLQMQRMYILKHLEPYRHYTRDELISLKGENLIDEELMLIKINFSTFVDRFERENTNVTEFASAVPFEKKIKIITDKLREYGKEQRIGNQTKTAAVPKDGGADIPDGDGGGADGEI